LYPQPTEKMDEEHELSPQEFSDPTFKFVTFLSNNILNKEYPSKKHGVNYFT